MMRLAAALASAVLLAASAATAAPSPRHVIDNAGTLFETTRDYIEQKSVQTSVDTGVELFVVVQQNLGGRSAREAALAAPIWDPSREQVLLLLSMTDRQVRIEASPSVVARIPDAQWARLIETEMLPKLRRGRNGAAVRAGVDAIGAELVGHPAGAGVFQPRGDARALRDLVLVLIAGLLAAVSFNGARHLKIRRGGW